ncbi:MAG TPA: hypothetical protein VFO01_00210 [Trebonia sp.]|nr:hypothetical protein [Trebonia sp.]
MTSEPSPAETDGAALIDLVVRAQTEHTVRLLADDGPLRELVAAGTLGIVGAYYDLVTGVVTRLITLGF